MAERTGQPIRAELRLAAEEVQLEESGKTGKPLVLVLGGSQGSIFLNNAVIDAAPQLPESVDVTLATGRDNYEACLARSGSHRVNLVPYLELDQLVHTYRRATVAIARSGGTIAEFALFRLPSVLVPLPSSADDHQLHNAEEFVEMGAASLLKQGSFDAQDLVKTLDFWSFNESARAGARVSLQQWDVCDATDRIVAKIEAAARA
jgi:UDP-N-acetylglucosamine--N-acetylmuramyl-(pentapeptide) pyrophosphoryl-undecaprenol N-acetylglucosamine transferase